MNKHTYKNHNNRKKIILAAGLVVLIIGTSLFLVSRHNTRSAIVNPPTGKAAADDTINLSPPTQEDAQRVEDNKAAIIARDEQAKQSQTNTSGKKSVTPVITYADQYNSIVEVGSNVQQIFENGGTCTATFTKGSLSFSKSVQAVTGSNYVNCPVIEAAVSEFKEKGTWNVVVNYESPNASGTSEAKQVKVE